MYNTRLRIVFAQAARKHRIGRGRIRTAMADAGEPVRIAASNGKEADRLLYIGTDNRGVELEVIAVEIGADRLLVIHAMPVHYRRRPR